MGDRLGATLLEDGACRFVVWAPRAGRVELVLPDRALEMQAASGGYFRLDVQGLEAGTRYRLALDGGAALPDPASRRQPEGAHGPSAIVDMRALARSIHVPTWRGIPIRDYVVYELHVGTFTPQGNFDGVVGRLDELRELGVTAIELMPVAQFPGTRNWGYDGVYPFAVQDSYGGPEGLARLIGECHRRGLAVVLDVVYNHVGPEGGHLSKFGPYFAARYRTPWGMGMNFDAEGSGGVRRFFIENALQWVEDYAVDALRLDAVDRIHDRSPRHFLTELGEAVHQRARDLGRHVCLIAESFLDDGRMVLPRDKGGHGLDAQWADDIHHSLHALLTGDRSGYYSAFGGLGELARAYRNSFIYRDAYVPGRQRVPGRPPDEAGGERFVAYVQNHDQVGNPASGERLSKVLGFEGLKLAAGLLLLSPFVPLLFMGEEYGEEAPFNFFVSFSDERLAEAVRRGRISDFASFGWRGDPPDPASEDTFERSKLSHDVKGSGRHHLLWNLYRELLTLRREVPALASMSRKNIEVKADEELGVLIVSRWTEHDEALAAFNTRNAGASARVAGGGWRKRFDSAEERWGGCGSGIDEADEGSERTIELKAHSFALFTRGNVVEVET